MGQFALKFGRYYLLIVTLLTVGIAQVVRAQAENLEPALQHPAQQSQVATKLEMLRRKFDRPPNIIILLVDDLGWGDPGVYGGGEAIGAPTPNIDRLAHEGLRLTSAYAQPTCSPTRAAINTGRLPIRNGVIRPPLYGEPGGLEGEITAASILQANGYRTAMVGKWHLGESESQQPQNNGYDEYFGILGSSSFYSEWQDEHLNPDMVFDQDRYQFSGRPFYKEFGIGESWRKVARGEGLEHVQYCFP